MAAKNFTPIKLLIIFLLLCITFVVVAFIIPLTSKYNPYTWPVKNVSQCNLNCPAVIFNLRDGTMIYKRSDGSLVRGFRRVGTPYLCLSSRTKISAPSGEYKVTELKIGMFIQSINTKGERIAVPILKTSKVPVPLTYRMVHLKLSDGRELTASSGHPTSDNRLIGNLKAGDEFDGAQVIETELVRYYDGFTYDILPAGDTGFYWANGVLIGSTLKD